MEKIHRKVRSEAVFAKASPKSSAMFNNFLEDQNGVKQLKELEEEADSH